MSTASPVLLILGAGSNVGASVAKSFAEKGYKIALASRTIKENSNSSEFHISCDLSDPLSLHNVFGKVKETVGIPSVVVYNAAAATRANLEDPLLTPLADFTQNLNINTTSVYAAAQEAVKGFAELPADASKTFIYTGNILNLQILPPLLDLGVGKAATAHIIEYLAASYTSRGFKFYYADQRKPDGSSISIAIDGEAHGKFYVQLAEIKSQDDWHQTFVKDIGYQRF
ncbi:short-chain dehydrogenase [Penicillium longicatenatum]|uniref:short-chain dehydrogenase n=1 Tax=Penicillium longicatenatum TaxID=1561947 RepID=UPI002547DC59|nr:short-chain dehydrogenase [Penicillium longicatenatum]KAJ5631676.1 short-chain dehydrogenase [Penicillium longicatenatum]